MIVGLETPSLNERKVRIFHRCASRIVMEPTNLPQWQFQIAMLVGLLVFPLIWARGMRRYSPIQDLSQAYKALIIGFIVGAILASALDVWVFQTMYTDLAEAGGIFIIEILPIVLLAGWAEAALCMYLSARAERKVPSSATTTGYAFGIGSAAMLTAYACVRAFDPQIANVGADTSGFGIHTIVLGFVIGITSGFSLAPMGASQGSNILVGIRFTPVMFTGIARAFIRLGIFIAILSSPLVLTPIIMFAMWADARAQNMWLPSSLTPLQRRVERRMKNKENYSQMDNYESE